MHFAGCLARGYSAVMIRWLTLFLLCLLWIPSVTHGAFDELPFSETVFKAKVLAVGQEGTREIPQTGLTESYQELTVVIVEGDRTGETITLENDSPVSLKEGSLFYLHRLPPIEDSPELWSVGEPDRSGVLTILLALFVLTALVTAGKAGARALLALAVSFAGIIWGLLPLLYAGWSPAITALLIGTLILAVSMFITHGINKGTVVALVGSVAALMFSALIAHLAVLAANLSGFVSDETVFLNFATDGALNLQGLLLGGILVGIIGVLNDVSVSQVHTVIQLREANPSISRTQLWQTSMKVGQEHLGAVINTLPLAYAGASLPLLLLFSTSPAPFSFIVNREIFSAEVIRALAGSIGLMLSGVIATGIAVLVLSEKGRGTITRPVNN